MLGDGLKGELEPLVAVVAPQQTWLLAWRLVPDQLAGEVNAGAVAWAFGTASEAIDATIGPHEWVVEPDPLRAVEPGLQWGQLLGAIGSSVSQIALRTLAPQAGQ
jgi:hypothetical protein